MTYARRRASLPTTCAASIREAGLASARACAAQLAVAVDRPHHPDDAVPAQVDHTRLDAHRHEDVEPAAIDIGDRPSVEMGNEQHELRLGHRQERRVAQGRSELDDRPHARERRGKRAHGARSGDALSGARDREPGQVGGRPARMLGAQPVRGANDRRPTALDHGRDRALRGAGHVLRQLVDRQIGRESHRTDCMEGPQVR